MVERYLVDARFSRETTTSIGDLREFFWRAVKCFQADNPQACRLVNILGSSGFILNLDIAVSSMHRSDL